MFLAAAGAAAPAPAAAWELEAEAAQSAFSDPFESVNRAIHDFNLELRRDIGAPALEFAESWLSPSVRAGAIGVVGNLEEPVTVLANLLAGDLESAENASWRFLINTFMGWGGVEDVAAQYGYERRPADLRKVLCRYGVPAGPYVVVPVFGEAHLRDLVGRYGTLIGLYELLGNAYIPYRISAGVMQSLEPGPGGTVAPPTLDKSYEAARARVYADPDAHCRS